MLASRWPVIEMRHLREGVEGEGGGEEEEFADVDGV